MYFPSSHVKTPSAISFSDLIIVLIASPLYGKVMMPFILLKYTDGIGSSIIVSCKSRHSILLARVEEIFGSIPIMILILPLVDDRG